MSNKWKSVTAVGLVLVLLATLGFGCGDDGEEEKTVITIGFITDFTGPAVAVLLPNYWVLQDLVKHINEEDPIPGVELKVIAYDARVDPSRTIPGYEWLKERGAKVIFTIFDWDAETLKPFAERDKVPVVSMSVSQVLLEPPGWVFCAGTSVARSTLTVLEWIGEQWDYGQGVPRIGCITSNAGSMKEAEEALRDYCQANPDGFDYVAGVLHPPTAISVTASEVERLKDCDWIALPASSGFVVTSLVERLQAIGYTPKFFSQEDIPVYRGLFTDKLGYEAMDGWICSSSTGWWTDQTPVVDLVTELLYRYHAGDAEDIIHTGIGYVGGGVQVYFLLQLLRQAIEEAGAEGFDGQAFYDTAVKSKVTMEGFEEWGFSDTRRDCLSHTKIYKVSAEAQALVSVSDWIPLIEE